MTPAQLHGALDELLAAYLEENRAKLPSTTSVLELIEWSARRVATARGFVIRESGGSVPAAGEENNRKLRAWLESNGIEPPVLNKSGGSDVEGK